MNNPVRNSQLLQLVLAHMREIVREPAVLFWGIIFPILMSLGLGVAFTNKKDVTHDLAIVGTMSPALDSLIREHGSTSGKRADVDYLLTLPNPKIGNTTFRFRKMDWAQAMVRLKRGELNVIISDSAGNIRYHFDPLNPDGQLTYMKLSNLVENHDLLNPESQANITPLTVTGTRYIDFLIPGLIALGVITACMWGISYTIIERRAKKLLRRMVATPMKKSNLLMAMMTVRIGMNFVESGLLLLFAWLVFGIRIQGSIPALFAIFISGNVAFTGLAIFISSHTSKTEIGNGLINAITMPMMVLSGIFFSYHNFPVWSLGFIKILPLTIMVDGIRAIFNEGAGWTQVSIPSLILLATGIVFFTVGLRIFKWH
jgi:ABC-2 type transport system permease protein